MHAWVRRALCAVGVTGGIVLLGIGLAETASADDGGPTTTGENGIVSGNQTGAQVAAPLDLSGNQVTVLGQGNQVTSTGSSGTPSGPDSASSPTTSGEGGAGSGNQTTPDVQAPVNASGNQVTVLGQDNTTDASGSSASSAGDGSGSATTSGQSGTGSGNQTGVAVAAPVNASGNQVTVIGQDNTVTSAGGTGAATAGDAGPTSTGESGIGSGNQTGIALIAPVATTGNQVTLVGQDNAVSSTGGTTTGGSDGPGETTSGAGGIGSGNQTPIVVLAPVDTAGNQVTVIGRGNTARSTSGSGTDGATPVGGATAPPGGTVVSPPSGGPATNASQGGSAPGASALPSTGLAGDVGDLGLLGLFLLGLGGLLIRRSGAPAHAR